jgi:hypothetical protein
MAASYAQLRFLAATDASETLLPAVQVCRKDKISATPFERPVSIKSTTGK